MDHDGQFGSGLLGGALNYAAEQSAADQVNELNDKLLANARSVLNRNGTFSVQDNEPAKEHSQQAVRQSLQYAGAALGIAVRLRIHNGFLPGMREAIASVTWTVYGPDGKAKVVIRTSVGGEEFTKLAGDFTTYNPEYSDMYMRLIRKNAEDFVRLFNKKPPK